MNSDNIAQRDGTDQTQDPSSQTNVNVDNGGGAMFGSPGDAQQDTSQTEDLPARPVLTMGAEIRQEALAMLNRAKRRSHRKAWPSSRVT